MRRLSLFLALGVVLASLATGPYAAAQTDASPDITPVSFDTVDDWNKGVVQNILISNNANGELRLADGASSGSFTSDFIPLETPINAIGASWKAEIPADTSLTLEVRAGPAETELRDWVPLQSFDARSQSDSAIFGLPAVLAVVTDTVYVQFRASFESKATNASPILSEAHLSLINSLAGPVPAVASDAVAAPYGPLTQTSPPRIVLRQRWDPDAPTTQVSRQTPNGIVLHQIDPGAIGDDPSVYLRAMAAYQINDLGWDDLPYHFIVAPDGMIYEGHIGGPTAIVPRLAGGDSAIHVAILGSGELSSGVRNATSGLLAWLGEAYDIAPRGQHTLSLPNGNVERPNIAAHSDIVPEAAAQSEDFTTTVALLRQLADQATVRSRWYFAEGNPKDYAERLSVFNPSPNPATVRFRILRDPGPEVIRTVSVASGARSDLLVSGIFTDTTDAPAIIESNEQIIAERYMDFGKDITFGPGIQNLSRVWYFAEGSTEGNRKTFLLLFNPGEEVATATITYLRSDGTTAQQSDVEIQPGKRTVIAVNDILPNTAFGARVIADRPIAAERTMIFGQDSSLQQGGVHTAAGVSLLSRTWYFAEGTTQSPFQMRLLVLNPNTQPITTTVTFQTPDGTSLTRRYAIPASTRLAINVNEVVPELGVATRVEADRPIVAERAMYWNNDTAGSVTPGATAAAFTWRFADGRTNGDTEEYLLFNNPDKNTQARVSVEFTKADGSKATQQIVVPGGSRYTMAVHQLYPDQQSIAAVVNSTVPIVVERSVFLGPASSDTNRGGATSLGIPESQP